MDLTALFRPFEKASLLDRVSDPVAARLRSVLSDTPVDGLLRGTFVGHPMHPIMAYSSVGLWSSAVFLDVTGRSPDAARTLLGAGLVTAPTALVTGWATWSTLTREQRRVGLVHASTNAVAIGLFAASYKRRAAAAAASTEVETAADATAKALALAGFAVAGLGGALGGHLGYNMGAGVSTRAVAAGV
ncbi:DUF2231 domain-containing protein [Rhodococcoides corynebacterioides]|uniref:DUF2231 domain-containing protein n=1 Tax=Rhodococcoides corynebacterioides TaxID=53972 RepID=UPI001C9AF0BE|nr:DUF2231 domain-containing protein [Rhodococcus corynebacterioides]MBY6362881.1 hypothetical protein [Rhodococcus corynebacterioides]